jgi:hypothetical protein
MNRREFLKLAAATVASLPVASRALATKKLLAGAPPEPNDPERIHVPHQTHTTVGPRLIIPMDGMYLIHGAVKWNVEAEHPRTVTFNINGLRFPLPGVTTPGEELEQEIKMIYEGKALDHVEMQVFHRGRQQVQSAEATCDMIRQSL